MTRIKAKRELVKQPVLVFFVELDSEIQGLAHIGELGDPTPKDVNDVLKIGQEKEFKIINIEPEEHRLGLSLKALTQKEEPKAETNAEPEKQDS